MKNFTKTSTAIIVLVVIGLIGLVVYGVSDKNVVTLCKIEKDGVNIKYEYEHEEGSDDLIKITSTSKTNYVEYNWTKESALEQLEAYAKSIEGEGIEYTYKVDGDYMIEILVIDLEKADLVYMSELNYISRPADGVNVVSLSETVKNAKSLGASCEIEK